MKKMDNFEVKLKKERFFIGCLLVFLGIAMPAFLNVYNFNVYPLLLTAIHQADKSCLVLSAFNLVMLNSIRGLPHYLGTFLIAESIDVTYHQKKIKLVRVLLSFAILWFVYHFIDELYHIQYDFGIPTLMMLVTLVLLGQMDAEKTNIIKKSIILITLLMAMQWLDIVPALSKFAFGRGEMSCLIKSTADFIDANGFIQGTALLFFTIFFLCSLMIWKLILDEETMKKINERNEANEKILVQTQLRVIEDRTYKEVQSLVHDLKTPLTSMQALVGVLKMEYEENAQTEDYLTRIERSIDRLSQMISDILYENAKSYITTDELLIAIQAQISNLEYASYLRWENLAPEDSIFINKTRFYRAIINIIENSFYAIDKENGQIAVSVTHVNAAKDAACASVVITVRDNGTGMDAAMLESIWEKGYSSRNTTGFGLAFVRTVIEKHSGTIAIESECGKGTTTTIAIPI